MVSKDKQYVETRFSWVVNSKYRSLDFQSDPCMGPKNLQKIGKTDLVLEGDLTVNLRAVSLKYSQTQKQLASYFDWQYR